MKTKIIIAVIVAIIIGGAYVMMRQTPRQGVADDLDVVFGTKGWNTYNNDKYGFKVKYPSDWQLLGSPLGTSDFIRVAFGQKKNVEKRPDGYDGEWFVFVYNKQAKTAEEIIKSMGSQFQDRQEKRENIVVGNLPALNVIVTTSTLPGWYDENIIIEQPSKIYVIGNGAIKNPNFDVFVGSFELL